MIDPSRGARTMVRGPPPFRRVSMSFHAWLVGFGLSRVAAKLGLLPEVWAFQLLTLTIIVDAILLRTFFRSRGARRAIPDEGVPSVSLRVP